MPRQRLLLCPRPSGRKGDLGGALDPRTEETGGPNVPHTWPRVTQGVSHGELQARCRNPAQRPALLPGAADKKARRLPSTLPRPSDPVGVSALRVSPRGLACEGPATSRHGGQCRALATLSLGLGSRGHQGGSLDTVLRGQRPEEDGRGGVLTGFLGHRREEGWPSGFRLAECDGRGLHCIWRLISGSLWGSPEDPQGGLSLQSTALGACEVGEGPAVKPSKPP